MRIAILDPAAGISGDMTLAALLSLGLPVEWLEELPGRLGVGDVRVTVRDVRRAGIICKQVEFAIPAQPHGRHVGELLRLVEKAPVSDWVKSAPCAPSGCWVRPRGACTEWGPRRCISTKSGPSMRSSTSSVRSRGSSGWESRSEEHTSELQ